MRANLMNIPSDVEGVIFLDITRADGMPFIEYKYNKPSKASSLENDDFKKKTEESIAGLDPMPDETRLTTSSLKKFKRRWGQGTLRMFQSEEQ